ncbi:MAG TPA: DUF3152 domain-containing protein [Dermatophilaceae bacterium]|nr:DUF3152 domain-containing protein [Dermatophilaceae bacterium]
MRRLHRLRRSVLVAVVLLSLGTLAARAVQDPSVALPRPGAGDAAIVAQDLAQVRPLAQPSLGSAVATPDPARPPGAALQAPSVSAHAPVATGASSAAVPAATAIAEEGAAEPTAAAGTTLAPVQDAGAGTMHVVALPADMPVRGEGRTVRLAVEVEDGLAVDEAEFARIVASVLTDSRGWQASDGVRFVPLTPEQVQAGSTPDLRVTLASPRTTARLCAPLNTYGPQVSCWNGSRAVLNLHRWVRGAATYGADLATYRIYLVNHEVGHGLGHGHVGCSGVGRPAPVMVQQTMGLDGCTAWPWPTRPPG